jgi:hypothetical protein
MLAQNVWYDYPTSEFQMIVNGKGKPTPLSTSTIDIECVEACGDECLEALEEVTEMEDFFRYWSDPTNWPDNKIPEEGSNVEIKGHWNMVLDIEETPLFEFVGVFGRLTFSDEMDVHLHVKHLSI